MDEIFAKKAWCSPVAVASSTGLSITSDDASVTSGSEISSSKCISKPFFCNFHRSDILKFISQIKCSFKYH